MPDEPATTGPPRWLTIAVLLLVAVCLLLHVQSIDLPGSRYWLEFPMVALGTLVLGWFVLDSLRGVVNRGVTPLTVSMVALSVFELALATHLGLRVVYDEGSPDSTGSGQAEFTRGTPEAEPVSAMPHR